MHPVLRGFEKTSPKASSNSPGSTPPPARWSGLHQRRGMGAIKGWQREHLQANCGRCRRCDRKSHVPNLAPTSQPPDQGPAPLVTHFQPSAGACHHRTKAHRNRPPAAGSGDADGCGWLCGVRSQNWAEQYLLNYVAIYLFLILY